MLFLCCDLGGTTAEWAVYNTEIDDFDFRVRLMVSEFEDFYAMMDHFLVEFRRLGDGTDKTIVNTTFGIAGPTNHREARPTNIEGWEINTITANSILEDHGHKGYSSIINDFEALGYGILYMYDKGFSNDDFEPIYGRFKTGPARLGEEVGDRSLVCGPGTGLGVACLVDGLKKDGFPYIFSSEGGHRSLSPESPEQYRFLSDSGSFDGKKSYEDALSHAGLKNMYNFFRREDYSADPNYSISSSDILTLAKGGQDQAALDTIELFCEILANFCGNAALTFNCNKHVFLWGGAVKEMPRDLIKTRFKRYYADRCRYSDLVAKVPVVLITNESLPLFGCVHRSIYEAEYLMDKVS